MAPLSCVDNVKSIKSTLRFRVARLRFYTPTGGKKKHFCSWKNLGQVCKHFGEFISSNRFLKHMENKTLIKFDVILGGNNGYNLATLTRLLIVGYFKLILNIELFFSQMCLHPNDLLLVEINKSTIHFI